MNTLNSPYLFNNPNIIVNEEGDVLPDPGVVPVMNPRVAEWELRKTHGDSSVNVLASLAVSEEKPVIYCGDGCGAIPCMHTDGRGSTRG